MNSTFANLDGHRKMEARTASGWRCIRTMPESRGIADGDAVRVWNDRGQLTLTALVTGSRARRRGGGADGLGQAVLRTAAT